MLALSGKDFKQLSSKCFNKQVLKMLETNGKK